MRALFGRKKKEQHEYDEYDEEEYEYDEYEEEDEEYEDYDEEDYEEYEERESKRKVVESSNQRNSIEKENATLLKEITHLKTKLHILEISEAQPNTELEKDLQRLTQTVERLQKDAILKQKEVDQLTVQLLDVGSSQQQIADFEAELVKMKQVADAAIRKSEELQEKQDSEVDIRISIADVMIEAKDSSRQIISKAEFEAQQKIEKATMKASRMVSEATTELAMIKKDAADYYKQLDYTREEATVMFDQLLLKLSGLREK